MLIFQGVSLLFLVVMFNIQTRLDAYVCLSPISFSTEPAFWGELQKHITHLTNHLPAASFEGFKENPSFVLGMA